KRIRHPVLEDAAVERPAGPRRQIVADRRVPALRRGRDRPTPGGVAFDDAPLTRAAPPGDPKLFDARFADVERMVDRAADPKRGWVPLWPVAGRGDEGKNVLRGARDGSGGDDRRHRCILSSVDRRTSL